MARRPAGIQEGASAWAYCEQSRRPSGDLITAHVGPSRPSAVSPTIEEALLALVEHTAAQAGPPVTGAVDSAAAVAEAVRQLTRGAALRGPVQLLEQQLSMVCLTLVQARQSATQGSSLAPEVDRLLGLIHNLERQLTPLARTNGPNPVLGSDGLGNAMPTTQSDAIASQEGPRGGALEVIALPSFSNASRTGLGAHNADRRLAPVEWSSPIPAPTPPELTAGAEEIGRATAPSAPEAILDDRMLERLLKFKAKRDSVRRRRRRLWCATAAIAVVLIVAITGAAKLWLHG
jgi:hypothetical protein